MPQYITEAQADTRYGERLPRLVKTTDENGAFINHDVWEDASTAEKGQALKQATLYIDRFVYDGEKKDPEQDMKFPRKGQTQLPDEVKEACLEAALFILERYTVNKEGGAIPTRYKQMGVSTYTSELGEATERVTFGNEQSVYTVITPFVKKWIKGSYNVTRWCI